jgi:hypothetical protein
LCFARAPPGLCQNEADFRFRHAPIIPNWQYGQMRGGRA